MPTTATPLTTDYHHAASSTTTPTPPYCHSPKERPLASPVAACARCSAAPVLSLALALPVALTPFTVPVENPVVVAAAFDEPAPTLLEDGATDDEDPAGLELGLEP